MVKMIRKIAIVILFIMLTACGFKLQGKHELPSYIKKLTIVSENNNDPFTIQLQDILANNGVMLSNRLLTKDQITQKEISILEFSLPVITQKINGYDSKGQVSQYRISAVFGYKLFDHTGNTIKKNSIERSRNYTVNPNQSLSNSSEQQIIAEELNIEIINELMRQLSSENPNNTNSKNSANIDKNDVNCPC